MKGNIVWIAALAALGAGCNGTAGDRKNTDSGLVAAVGHSDPAGLQVTKVWDMPPELSEISALAWSGPDRVACVEDNHGIIYQYNLRSGAVEERLRFSGKGDYEGLAKAGNVYYVLRSDGMLFEVTPGSGEPSVQTYPGPFSAANDCESLTWDAAGKRLLVGVKERDPGDGPGKGVYAFDPVSKRFDTKPVYVISDDGNDISPKGKKKKGSIRPSDILLQPSGKGLYVLDGPRSELLLTDAGGGVLRRIDLDKSIFPQPEGLCSDPSGQLYVSSEAGKRGKAVIARVQVE